jgi:Mg-chelatase subunit ChlD
VGRLFLSCLFILAQVRVQSQTNLLEKDVINQYTIEVNKLIWHVNLNIKNLADYQTALNLWFLNNSMKTGVAPSFSFAENLNASAVSTFLSNNQALPSNTAFNYQLTLKNLNKQVGLFDSFCRELQKIPKTGSKDDYYKKAITILHQIDNRAPEMVDLSYDFSLSCAVNYGKEQLPVELDRLKTTVGQCKNVIMAIRENSPIQVRSYLNLLNNAITSSREDVKFDDLRRVGEFIIDEVELTKLHNQILDGANLIAFWAEQYLQSKYTDEEVGPILTYAILAFNVYEGKAGCSGAYNALVGQAKNQYLFYTEEPMFFIVEERKKVPEKTGVLAVKKDTVVVSAPLPKEIEKVESVQEPLKPKPSFNQDDITTLDGALPNNLIIMMDVSASMKLTGKLPLLKSSISHLLDIMRPEDRISLIAYSGKAELLIANAGVHNRAAVLEVLDTLHSSGGTDILNGVNLAYKSALDNYMNEGNNRIIVATDGEFGVRPDLIKFVESKAPKEIVLSVFHFIDEKSKPTSKNKGLLLLTLSGKGNYKVISNSEQALQVLMKEVKKK